MHEEDAWNTLKGGGTEKREGETKIFEQGGKLGQESRGGCIKKRDWNILETMTQIKTFTPTLDYHLFGVTLNVQKGSARIKSQPDSQSAYPENF